MNLLPSRSTSGYFPVANGFIDHVEMSRACSSTMLDQMLAAQQVGGQLKHERVQRVISGDATPQQASECTEEHFGYHSPSLRRPGPTPGYPRLPSIAQAFYVQVVWRLSLGRQTVSTTNGRFGTRPLLVDCHFAGRIEEMWVGEALVQNRM